jgi:hypothetical protein
VGAHAEFAPAALVGAEGVPGHKRGLALQMTPLTTGCDGFFVGALERRT